MLTTFMLIQLGINVALLLGVARLLKERQALASGIRQREARVEARAPEPGTPGEEGVRPDRAEEAAPRPTEDDSTERGTSPGVEENRRAGSRRAYPVVAPDRLQGAASLLERGLPLDVVAEESALLEGEVQVLRNLARTAGGSAAGARTGRARPATKRTGDRAPRARTKDRPGSVERRVGG